MLFHSRLTVVESLCLVALCLIVVGATSVPREASGSSPNVLFIAIDDLRPELGCYGANYAQTPNLDNLAKSSVRFTNHFVQVPTCGASRYALLTGRSPANSGVTARNHHFYRGDAALSHDRLPGAQSMPELFRRSGYRTVCVGKISHTPDGRVFEYDGQGDGRDEVPLAWDDLPTPFGAWKRGWGTFFAYANGKHREDTHGNRDLMEFVVENDNDLPDGLIAEEAIRQIQGFAKSDKPFFLGVGFFKPHLPFVAPQQDWDAIKDTDVPPPPYVDKPEHSAHWHKSGEFFKYDFPFPKPRPLPANERDQCRKAYLACVRYTDRLVGRVLQALDDAKLADNTIVVVWGDHGWNLGDAQLWAKHTPLERAVRSPLIIRIPGMKYAGASSAALVETTDIYPTLVDLCKPQFTTTQHPLDGMSLRPILRDPSSELRSTAISYWQNAISIRDKQHRLIVKRSDSKDGDRGESSLPKDRFLAPELYSKAQTFDPIENLAEQMPAVVESLLNAFRMRHP